MVGQIQILSYMLAVYLVYKGYEILHLTLVSPKENKTLPLILGIFALIGSIGLAIVFVIMMDEQASKVGSNFLK